MKKFAAILLSVLLLLTAIVPVSADDEPTYSDSVDWDKFRGQNVTINVYNWGEYISVDDGFEEAFDTNREFEELTGINVNYTNFASNEELYAKLKNGGAAYDIIIPSDYMIARMINENMLEKLNYDNIPNFDLLISDEFKGMDYDPKDEYSVPYMWGMVGIIYNTTLVDEEDDMHSWDILWNEKYAGNILMFSNSRDAFMVAEKYLGYSMNTTDEQELKHAASALTEQKLLVQAYVMDEIFDKMIGGEAAIAPYYAGDALTMIADNPDLAYAVPVEGTNLFVDAMCIPKGAKNKEAAEMYINFMCETLVALRNCEYIGYSTPQKYVLDYLDPELANDPIAYPDEATLANTEAFIALPDATTKLIDELWTGILTANAAAPWTIPVFLLACLGLSIGINVWRSKKKKRNS
ncbi:MAG: ABC transporter substrate-binding protein [Ruminococcaceae bacterium]|nr:ABC transporter substrate-binding protein [Oscillospiraceae bacterium]